MKKIIPALFILVSLLSCNSESTEKQKKTEAEKKVSKRDLSIDANNSYSDLFMDSSVMVEFFKENQLGDSLVRRMTSFYNTRNYQYAWFNTSGLTEHGRGFWNLHEYATTYANDTFMVNKDLSKTINGLLNESSVSISKTQKNILQAELRLTSHFILYALNNIDDGFIKRKEMERFVPRIKEDALKLADSLLTKKHKDGKYYEDVNEPYKQLKAQLQHYYTVATSGGWPLVPGNAKQLKQGAAGADILLLKKRLFLSKDMPALDTIPAFDAALTAGINNFQLRHGYTPTGTLTDAQLKDMNVPAAERVKQILVNMGRMQWMIHQPEDQLMLVNIPEFKLHVMEGSKEAFDMDVVVGKEGNNTMIFTGHLNQVVFSPYWNVPPDIIREEIWPAMQRNPNYLATHNMEQTGMAGGLPVVRQLPGPDNSLGQVKFLFPNSFNIYFHDTPAKTLFQKDKRAFSHGCIRLAEPAKFASYLLKDQQWSDEKINEAMNNGEEKYVKLNKTIPVLITYYTAWVDNNGLLHFADDIYEHDKRVAGKMFL